MVLQHGTSSSSPLGAVDTSSLDHLLRDDENFSDTAFTPDRGSESDSSSHPSSRGSRPKINRNGSESAEGICRRPAVTERALEDTIVPAEPAAEPKVTWRSLPRKDQLAILTIARLSEPLAQTSLQAYMFYQLKSFDPSLSDSTISWQAGVLQSAFTATQFLTAVAWGRAADSEYLGRKSVLLIGLLGTSLSSLGFGFSKSFAAAMAFRLLGGALNGNVGILRTMISEVIKENKRAQARAFLLLPMMFNVGVIIGPILGGLLANPLESYPRLFGPGSMFGGKDGVGWMKTWPYALPNIVSALFLFVAALCTFMGLEETHDVLKHRRDRGLELGGLFVRLVTCRFGKKGYRYSSLPDGSRTSWEVADDTEDVELQNAPSRSTARGRQSSSKPRPANRLPFSRIWTRNVVITLVSHGILAMHVGTYTNLWFIFLSTRRWDPEQPHPPSHTAQRFPVSFTGGLGLPPPQIGLALSILGGIGIVLQLSLYPYLSGKFGTVLTYRVSLALFPLAHLLTPYLALLPSSSAAPAPVAGAVVWAGMIGVLAIQVFGRTFALPATIILVNNCCPHPSVLGTVHGIAQAVSSATRTVGPIAGGVIFGVGLDRGIVGLAFWILMLVAIVGACVGLWVKEGSGWEIKLEGEDEDEESVAGKR